MPCWYYDRKAIRNSPSAADGIDFEKESRYRREGARFIMDCGTQMKLEYNTMATGVVYFHRFYMFHSFKMFPRYVTASCCLLLAGKVEETPKKCKDIIRQARALLSDLKFATFGEDPKEEVMTLERILLQTIKFDLQVEHPYPYLLKYAKCLLGDKDKLTKMVQMAWIFINDSLCTTLSLQWEPEIIAVALMYLAGKLSKFDVVDWKGRTSKHIRWWDMFVEDITLDLLEDICHQVLDLYSTSNVTTPDSPPYVPREPGQSPQKSENGVTAKEIGTGPVPNQVLKAMHKPVPAELQQHFAYNYAAPSGPMTAYPPAFSTPLPAMNQIPPLLPLNQNATGSSAMGVAGNMSNMPPNMANPTYPPPFVPGANIPANNYPTTGSFYPNQAPNVRQYYPPP